VVKSVLEEIEMHENINIAFDRYSTAWNSIDKINISKAFSHEVLLEIDKIYDYVSQYIVNWEIDSMKTVLERLEKDIRITYPYLNDKSIAILKNYFSYEWK